MVANTNLTHRSISSATWNLVASITSVVVLFIRAVILARLLPIEVFGVYALAGSIVALTYPIPSFGLNSAFLHRTLETENEEQAAGVHFTLNLIFIFCWAVLMISGAFIFCKGQILVALIALIIFQGGIQLTQTPRVILNRRVIHKRLALLQILNSIFTTIIAVTLALKGVALWTLLSTNLVTFIIAVIALYTWRPVWRPKFIWSVPIVRYYLRFGVRTLLANLLTRVLDRIDNLWTGIFLGKTPLGFYSRAYRFATYPSNIVSVPINAVAGGTYAELNGDRKRLSRAFFRVNAFLVRSGFFLGGLLILIAPQFVRILLGVKWLPMVNVFRLMLIFTLLDPIKGTLSNLFIAVGKPERIVRARLVQLVVLASGLFLLGSRFGIIGVALAVDLMLLVGIVILFREARNYVDFSLIKLFATPGLALLLGIFLAYGISLSIRASNSDWQVAFIKIFVFIIIYGVVLFIKERRQIKNLIRFFRDYIFKMKNSNTKCDS